MLEPFGDSWRALNGAGEAILVATAPSVVFDGKAIQVANPRARRAEQSLTLEYRLPEGTLVERVRKRGPTIQRSLEFRFGEGVDGRFEGFRLGIHQLGEPGGTVTAPGPFWPWNYVRPSSSLAELGFEPKRLHSAPDGSFGFVAVEGKQVTAATWFDTRAETNVETSIRAVDHRLEVEARDHRHCLPDPNQSVRSGTQMIHLGDSGLRGAFAAHRSWISRALPMERNTPRWVRDAVILEAYPEYTNGFRGLTARLPFYREVGFNTLYLMPHWPGGYMPLDLLGVDPKHGTEEELVALIQEAHRLGMRVLFDSVIHGMSPESELVRTRPELFVHERDGTPARHRTWKSVSTDWSNPHYQEYMGFVAADHVRRFKIDGYRVDAAGFKGPGWYELVGGVFQPSKNPPAYRRGSDAPAVMRAMQASLRKANPEAVLLSEVFGPVFNNVCNFTHDNQTEGPAYFLEALAEGRVDAEDYRRHLADVFALLPRGANRVYFTRNHDTSWFYRFGGYTPAFFALEAAHALCAIPEVFGGDPNNGPNPDDDPTVWERYKNLFRCRKLLRGELSLDRPSPNRRIFLAQRGKHHILISFSPREESLALPATGKQVIDVYTGKISATDGNTITLKPYQALLVHAPD
jgi:hypothetical protein